MGDARARERGERESGGGVSLNLAAINDGEIIARRDVWLQTGKFKLHHYRVVGYFDLQAVTRISSPKSRLTNTVALLISVPDVNGTERYSP